MTTTTRTRASQVLASTAIATIIAGGILTPAHAADEKTPPQDAVVKSMIEEGSAHGTLGRTGGFADMTLDGAVMSTLNSYGISFDKARALELSNTNVEDVKDKALAAKMGGFQRGATGKNFTGAWSVDEAKLQASIPFQRLLAMGYAPSQISLNWRTSETVSGIAGTPNITTRDLATKPTYFEGIRDTATLDNRTQSMGTQGNLDLVNFPEVSSEPVSSYYAGSVDESNASEPEGGFDTRVSQTWITDAYKGGGEQRDRDVSGGVEGVQAHNADTRTDCTVEGTSCGIWVMPVLEVTEGSEEEGTATVYESALSKPLFWGVTGDTYGIDYASTVGKYRSEDAAYTDGSGVKWWLTPTPVDSTNPLYIAGSKKYAPYNYNSVGLGKGLVRAPEVIVDTAGKVSVKFTQSYGVDATGSGTSDVLTTVSNINNATHEVTFKADGGVDGVSGWMFAGTDEAVTWQDTAVGDVLPVMYAPGKYVDLTVKSINGNTLVLGVPTKVSVSQVLNDAVSIKADLPTTVVRSHRLPGYKLNYFAAPTPTPTPEQPKPEQPKPVPTPTPEQPKPTPTPEQPKPTPTPEQPKPEQPAPAPTPTPEQPKPEQPAPAPTPTPEQPKPEQPAPAPTPTPEQPKPEQPAPAPTPTPEQPKPEPVPTPTPEQPKPEQPVPTPTPVDTPKVVDTPVASTPKVVDSPKEDSAVKGDAPKQSEDEATTAAAPAEELADTGASNKGLFAGLGILLGGFVGLAVRTLTRSKGDAKS